MSYPFEGFPHVLDTRQFSADFLSSLFGMADAIRSRPENYQGVLAGREVNVIFSRPSLRTFASSIKAAQRLGARVLAFENAEQFSSIAKGESLEDTLRVLRDLGTNYFIIRWHTEGSLQRAAEVCGNECPVINAGDGPGQHPTQALLDVYTITRELKTMDQPLVVVMVGDLHRGRTTHSLTYLLGKLYPNVSFIFISPPSAKMKPEIIDYLNRHHLHYVEVTTARLEDYAPVADVLYMTRPQTDQEDDPAARERLIAEYKPFILTPEIVSTMKPESIILHPLPRTFELPTDVDHDPRARYFQQAQNGLWVRMALLERIQNSMISVFAENRR